MNVPSPPSGFTDFGYPVEALYGFFCSQIFKLFGLRYWAYLLLPQAYDIERTFSSPRLTILSVPSPPSGLRYWAYLLLPQAYDIERTFSSLRLTILSVPSPPSGLRYWAYLLLPQAYDIERTFSSLRLTILSVPSPPSGLRYWLSCLGTWFSLLPKLIWLFERIWWRLFQKLVVRTKFDIYNLRT